MFRSLSVAILFVATRSSQAFMAPFPAPIVSRPSSALFEQEHMADSSLDVHNLRTLIDNLKPDNYKVSMEMCESLLMNEAVGHEYDEYMADLKAKCQEIGKPLPEGFAPTHH